MFLSLQWYKERLIWIPNKKVMKLNVRGLLDGNGRLRNSLWWRRMETETFRFCVSQMDGNGDLQILRFHHGRKWRLCWFRISKADGNGGLPIWHDGNWRKLTKTEVCRFCLTEIGGNGNSISGTDGNVIFVSVCFRQARFPFSVSTPTAHYRPHSELEFGVTTGHSITVGIGE